MSRDTVDPWKLVKEARATIANPHLHDSNAHVEFMLSKIDAALAAHRERGTDAPRPDGPVPVGQRAVYITRDDQWGQFAGVVTGYGIEHGQKRVYYEGGAWDLAEWIGPESVPPASRVPEEDALEVLTDPKQSAAPLVYSMLGRIAREVGRQTDGVGDSIDRGLILLRRLREEGFTVHGKAFPTVADRARLRQAAGG